MDPEVGAVMKARYRQRGLCEKAAAAFRCGVRLYGAPLSYLEASMSWLGIDARSVPAWCKSAICLCQRDAHLSRCVAGASENEAQSLPSRPEARRGLVHVIRRAETES